MEQFRIFFFLIILSISTILKAGEKFPLKKKDINVEQGVYNLVLEKRFSKLAYLSGLRTSREKYGFSRLNFKLTYVDKNEKKYFYINHDYSGLYIGANKESRNNKDQLQITAYDNILSNDKKDYLSCFEWEFVKQEPKTNSYIIRNKLGCELCEINSKFFCSYREKGTVFSLFKLYEEKDDVMSEEDKMILDAEPIDVFIKYIDTNDPKLIRGNLTQIKKDKENDELKYCIRSILQNIPWIRKIFILMPNEKVRYFKNISEINEKIIYVHDKDILGHESANIHAFQFRIWKLKEFGLSDNFISMDDDYFIGKPLQKSDFFYVENKTVYPAIVNNIFDVQTLEPVKKEINQKLKKMQNNKRTQTSDEFTYTVYRTYLFLIEYFKSQIIIPYFTHNAIPVNINDLKEVFDLVDNNTEFRYPTLYSLYRHPQSLQYQTTLVVYIFNKYNRKVNKIKYGYIDAANSITGNYDYPLFCINTGNNSDYAELSFMKMKVAMDYLFPIPTQYEIIDPKISAENHFNTTKHMDMEIKKEINKKKIGEILKEKYESERISRKYDKCKNQIDFLKAERLAYKMKIEKINLKIEQYKNESDMIQKKLNELQKANDNYHLIYNIRKKINVANNDIIEYQKKIKKYEKENEEYLNIINEMNNDEYIIKFVIFIQLLLIIAVIIGICTLYYESKKNKKDEVEVVGYKRFT